VVAVFDIKFVRTHDTTKMTNNNIIGLGFFPRNPTIVSAIMVPAPEVSSALASAREPPKRRTTFKSMDFSAALPEITPVSTTTQAPIQADT
jgi:hypothetical protein